MKCAMRKQHTYMQSEIVDSQRLIAILSAQCNYAGYWVLSDCQCYFTAGNKTTVKRLNKNSNLYTTH